MSHTVGCAFQICLERKQKRDRDCQVSIEYRSNDTSYTRLGSFRPTSLTERIIDPQSAQIAGGSFFREIFEQFQLNRTCSINTSEFEI